MFVPLSFSSYRENTEKSSDTVYFTNSQQPACVQDVNFDPVVVWNMCDYFKLCPINTFPFLDLLFSYYFRMLKKELCPCWQPALLHLELPF